MTTSNANDDAAPRSRLETAADEIRKPEESGWRLVLDTIPVLVTSARPDGSLDFINQRWLEFLGLSAEKVQDWAWTAVTHPDDIGGFVDGWRSAMATGEPFEGEARVPRADGQYRCLLVRAVPLRDETGRIVHWYATGIDIEDRRRAETALQRSEAYLAEAQRLSLTGSFAWNVSSGEVFWSDEMYRILGFDRATKSTHELLFQRIHPGDRDFVRATLHRASMYGTDLDIEHRLLMPEGFVKYVHVVGHTVSDETTSIERAGLEFVGAVMDVTAAKRAAEELHETQAALAHVTR